MEKDPKIFLTHIAQSIELVLGYVSDVSEESFGGDLQLQDAVVRRLEIIGEAVRNMPESYRARHPEVPWRDIVDFRNVLIHEYFIVDTDVVWTIVHTELPQLAVQIQALLAED